jgi:predicted nucleic acid-binding protein
LITAIDTNVLLDIFLDDQAFRARSLAALRACLADGPIVACEVVFAELTAVFTDEPSALRALARIPVGYSAIDSAAALRAGSAWGRYRRDGGSRQRIVADFLVGAHAQEQADRLLTRDRGFHRAAFEGLAIVDPTD